MKPNWRHEEGCLQRMQIQFPDIPVEKNIRIVVDSDILNIEADDNYDIRIREKWNQPCE